MKRMYWLLGVMSMICLAWSVRADIVRLRDGTMLEGTITEEDAISVTIQVERANGTVAEKRWVLKSDTTEVHHATAEEKAARAMELAFAALQKLQLNPTNSFQLEYYDRTLTNVFRKFLTDYTNSPHAKEVSDKIAEWEAERALVASGKVNVRGQWILAEEVAARAAREAVQQAYQQGLVSLRQKRSGEAVERFKFVIDKSDDTVLVQQARQLQTDAYQQWVTALEQQRQRLANEIKRLEQRVTDARNAKTQAEAKLNALTPGGGATAIYRGGDIRARARALGGARDVGAGEVTRMGTDANHAQSFAAASRARLELQAAETQLAEARREATATEETLARIRPQAAALGITTAPSGEVAAPSGEVVATQVVAAAARPAASTESPDVVTGIGQFATAYWIYFLAGAVILIWLVSRGLGR